MIRHAYLPLFYTVILKLAQLHRDMGVTLPIEYVFDEQGPVGVDAVIWYEHIKSWQKADLAALMGGSPEFMDDKVVPPLQAADMLAWHIRRWKDNLREDRSHWPTSPLDKLAYVEVRLTKDILLSIADQMNHVPGVGLAQKKSTDHSGAEFREIVRAMPTKRPQ